MSNAIAMIVGALAMLTLEAPLAYAEAAQPAPAASAQEQQPRIEGRHRVVGMGLDVGRRYAGQVDIKRFGDTYQLTWQIGQGRHVSTGFVFRSALSAVFVPSEGRPGVALYDIVRDGAFDWPLHSFRDLHGGA